MIAGLPVDALDWQPVTDANSPTVLVTHAWGAAEAWTLRAGGREMECDRAAEFRAKADSAALQTLGGRRANRGSAGRHRPGDVGSGPIRAVDAAVQRRGVHRGPLPGSLDRVDLVLVPGVVFDARGGRIGHGAGYYDCLLARSGPDSRLVVAAFEVQVVDEVAMEPHDRRVDLVVTERRVYPA